MKEIRHQPLPIAWVPADNYHLTLRFLGDVDQQFPSRLQSAWGSEGRQSCCLRLGAPGVFPSARRPKVFWFGLEGDTATLLGLSQEIEAVLEKLGFPRESKPFSPHLTVGRVRRGQSLQSLQLPPPLPLEWEVRGFSLQQSVLTPGRSPVYSILKTFPLRRDAGQTPRATGARGEET